MLSFNDDLKTRLEELRKEGLYRQLRRIDSPQGTHVQSEGKPLLNFSSNDYLGLANHAAVREAARQAIADFGAGSGASRMVCGSLAPHYRLEEALAAFKGTEAALTFSSGYATALGTIDALVDKGDVIMVDKLVHASVIDAARMSRAKLRVFGHNDLNELESILKWADQTHPWAPVGHRARKLIVTESVFSMDGDLASLREMVQLKERHGAWLMLDEAHATGLYGQKRRGVAEAFELADRVEIQMGTLGKALGSAGGYICGSRALVDFLVNKARSFIFTTAPPPGTAAAAQAALQVVQSAEGETLRTQLWARVDQVKNGLIHAHWPLPPVQSAIIPLIIGDERAAMEMADQLRQLGIFIPAIRYPTVARGAARLRLTLSATHTATDIAALLAGFAICKSREDRARPT